MNSNAPTFEHSDRSQKALPFVLFQKVITEAKEADLFGVKLTGGEPFIHQDIIPMLRYIRDQRLKLNIESNGTAITSHHADLFKSCPGAFISVSIDGKKENHGWMRGVKGSFERASQGVKTLVETGINSQVIMAVAGRNKEEMADLARYAQELGASSVKYNFVISTA